MKTQNLTIISGSQLRGSIPNFDEFFFDCGGRIKESKYLKILEDGQDYLTKLENGEITEDDYYDTIDDAIIRKGPTSVPYKLTEVKGIIEDPKGILEYNPVTVMKIKNHYYYYNNGRHRFYIAKKYNLKLPVLVIEEKNSLSKIEKENQRTWSKNMRKIKLKMLTYKLGKKFKFFCRKI